MQDGRVSVKKRHIIGIWFVAECVISALLLIGVVSAVSVHSVSSDSIIWVVEGEEQIIIDGELINTSGAIYYAQHNLAGGSEHIIETTNGTLSVTTPHNALSALQLWGIFIILFAFVIICYTYPITVILPAAYTLWIFGVYLPSINADFILQLVSAVGFILCCLGATLGGLKR